MAGGVCDLGLGVDARTLTLNMHSPYLPRAPGTRAYIARRRLSVDNDQSKCPKISVGRSGRPSAGIGRGGSAVGAIKVTARRRHPDQLGVSWRVRIIELSPTSPSQGRG